MANSDYDFIIIGNVIGISDLNLGRMSVTNNIEEVLLEIEAKKGIKAEDYLVIYKDSVGTIDGYNPATGRFYSLNHTLEAISIIKLKLNFE